MHITPTGAVLGIKSQKDIAVWLESMPELDLIAPNAHIEVVHGGTDAEVSARTWRSAARFIFNHRNDFSGFIVLSGLDNIPYFSQALQLLLDNISLPIVFTGSQLPDYLLEDKNGLSLLLEESTGVGIRVNMINAVQTIHKNFKGVFVVFGDKLITADRIFLKNPLLGMPFGYTDNQLVGDVEFSIKVNPKYEERIEDIEQGEMRLRDHMEESVKFFALSPVFETFNITEEINGCKGLLFYLPSTVSYPQALIEDLRVRKPLVPTVFCGTSLIVPLATEQALIRKLEGIGIIVVKDRSIPWVMVSFMWALGKTAHIPTIKKVIERGQQ